MVDPDRPTYEILISVEKQIAVLDERTRNTNENVASIKKKIDECLDLKERIAKVEAKQGILAALNTAFSAAAAGLATFLGRQN